jgi:hypothetical protein
MAMYAAPTMTIQRNTTMNRATVSKGENVPTVDSLTREVSRAAGLVDWWNSAVIVAMVFAAIAATVLVVAQAVAFKRAKNLADVSEKLVAMKDAELQRELKAKDVEIGNANARASEANKAASEAVARAAEANQYAAEANKKAEQERLARAKIEQAMTHRRLLPAAQSAIAAKLRAFAGQKIDVNPLSQDLEVQRITEELVVSLAGPAGAGWIVASRAGLSVGGPSVTGIAVAISPSAEPHTRAAARGLISALSGVGIGVFGVDDPKTGLAPQDTSIINITVGTRPGM